jgi:hypothetical protein
MRNPLRWLFRRRTNKGLEQCSVEELRQIKHEADHLAAAVDSTQGQLNPDDMERLKRLKQTVDGLNEGR